MDIKKSLMRCMRDCMSFALYLFLVWLFLAAGTAFILRMRTPRPKGPPDGAGPEKP